MTDISFSKEDILAKAKENKVKFVRLILAEAREMGFTMNVGPEPEFFLFKKDEKGNASTIPHDEGGYFDLGPVDMGENARRSIVLALEKMGFQVEASHHEVAPGQHEIDFKYKNALTTADNIATFKFVTKSIAHNLDLHATFMPKPISGINGSGMHMHQSLFKDNQNIFYDQNDERELSQLAYYYIGGLLKHARSITAITNPTINSYKRLVPGYEAPVYVAWSTSNRSALIRIPAARGKGTRLELRYPAANPYLAISVMLKAGLDGIKNNNIKKSLKNFIGFYSVLISGFLYPIVGHWIWGGGWLSQLGFIDFAGSTVVVLRVSLKMN